MVLGREWMQLEMIISSESRYPQEDKDTRFLSPVVPRAYKIIYDLRVERNYLKEQNGLIGGGKREI